MIQQLEPYTKRKLTFGIIKLTADEAEYIVENMAFERQRDIDHKHVGNLTDEMEHDEWVGMSMMLFAHHRRRLWLIDCQHRLRAQVEHARRISKPVTRSFIVQVVREDAAVAYARLDSRQKKRGAHVVAEALGLDIPPALLKPALGAAAYAARYLTRVNTTVQVGNRKVYRADQPYRDSIRYVQERHDAFTAFDKTLSDLTDHDKRVRKALLSTKILPICIETIVSRADDALRFWRSVVSGQNAEAPARYVRDRMHAPIPHLAKKPDYVRAIATAAGWNAHVSGAFQRGRGTTVPVLTTDLEIR